MTDEPREPDSGTAMGLGLAETEPAESPLGQPGKWSVDEALAWLDTLPFETEDDSTEIIRKLRDGR